MFPFKKVRDVKTPTRGTDKSAGIDFYAPNDIEPITIDVHSSALIPSGLHFIIPAGYALLGLPRSGLASKHGIILGACLIDEDYRGEVHINLINTGNKPFVVNPGDKIAQFVKTPVDYEIPHEVSAEDYDTLSSMVASQRGTGGFGHTDKKDRDVAMQK